MSAGCNELDWNHLIKSHNNYWVFHNSSIILRFRKVWGNWEWFHPHFFHWHVVLPTILLHNHPHFILLPCQILLHVTVVFFVNREPKNRIKPTVKLQRNQTTIKNSYQYFVVLPWLLLSNTEGMSSSQSYLYELWKH